MDEIVFRATPPPAGYVPIGPTYAPGAHVLTPLALPGGPICRADCCLFVSGLPVGLSPVALRQECERHCHGMVSVSGRKHPAGPQAVDSVHIGSNANAATAPNNAYRLMPGEAFVVFTSVR
jgi:hypothetical protein